MNFSLPFPNEWNENSNLDRLPHTHLEIVSKWKRGGLLLLEGSKRGGQTVKGRAPSSPPEGKRKEDGQ
jgi:hypothetical protein